VMPRQIDHLKVRVNDINSMKYVLERVKHVLSVRVTFQQEEDSSNSMMKLKEWLTENKRNFSVTDNDRYIQIWLTNDNTELSE
jgi:hypothetical protein